MTDCSNGMEPGVFNESEVIKKLKHYLPSQTPLKDFIHHNSLHAFQHMKFYDGIFKASRIFGYQVTLELDDYRKLLKNGRISNETLDRIITQRKGPSQLGYWRNCLLNKMYDTANEPRIGQFRNFWKSRYHIDLDTWTQPLLFRILCSYLDQGIAIAKFPIDQRGFLASLRSMEKNSFVSLFRTSRASSFLLDEHLGITDLLRLLVGDQHGYECYLFDQQFAHKGWSGIVSAIEDRPGSLLDQRNISLKEVIFFELLLEIDSLDYHLGDRWKPLLADSAKLPGDLFSDVPLTELMEVFSIWQDAFEWSHYDEVLSAISVGLQSRNHSYQAKSFQAIFCIDERECSLRRHIEHIDPECETFGSPGFFGVEFFFQPHGGKFKDKLAPAPVEPAYLVKEAEFVANRHQDVLFTNQPHRFFHSFIYTVILGIWPAFRMIRNLLFPKMSPAISNAFAHMNREGLLMLENGNQEAESHSLKPGFTVEEMSVRVEKVLRGIGLIKDFAPLVYVIGHGSSSANNPHHGAHDCGACSGRPGSVNARAFAWMANHSKVRMLLKARGIHIENSIQFVGGLHDTASDEIEYYDEAMINTVNQERHQRNKQLFEEALDLNAKERSRRFASIDTKANIKRIRKAIKERSVSFFEPRPELGHGTNSLCIIGRRQLTKHLFLDRRAFLNSYNYLTDPTGGILCDLLKPIGPVCGGINLEYYFSRVDNYKLGAGTKLPHNVVGLIGVANGCDGDIRPGLPVQMIEVHDPVRLLIIVEHFPEIVLQSIKATPEMYEWYINEWVHLVVLHPEQKKFYYFRNGTFSEYATVQNPVNVLKDVALLLESARVMESAHITDATRENLSVHLIN